MCNHCVKDLQEARVVRKFEITIIYHAARTKYTFPSLSPSPPPSPSPSLFLSDRSKMATEIVQMSICVHACVCILYETSFPNANTKV